MSIRKVCEKVTDHIPESISKAIQLIQESSFKDAVALLQQFVKEHPESLEGWYNLGYALSHDDSLEAALTAYDEALAIDNMIFEIWFNKGDVLYQLADFKNAKECYQKSVELNPDDAEAWNNLGNCHSRLGEGSDAIVAYTRAVAIRPDYAEAFYNKANAHFVEEDDEHAIAYAELAVQLDSELIPLVRQWIQVSRDRLAAKREHKEYEKRKLNKDTK